MTQSSLRPAALLGIVFAAAIAGFAVGFFLRGQDSHAAHASEAASPTINVVRSGSDVADRQDEMAEVDPMRSARSSAPSVIERNASPDRIQRVASGVKPKLRSLPVGDGEIRGKVETRDGKPLPDVSIFLVPPRSAAQAVRRASEATALKQRTRTLEETLEAAAKSWAKSEGLAQETKTGADGSFVFTDVPDRVFEVRAQAEGWTFTSKTTKLLRPGSHALLVGKAMPAFTLQLTSADGSPIDRALVSVNAGVDGWMEWTKEDPVVRVTRHQFSVRAIADVYELPLRYPIASRLVSQWLPVDIASDDAKVVTLELEPTCVLFGTMTGDQHGKSSVYVQELRPGETFDPSARLSGHRETSGRSGAFVFTELAPGRHAVGILGEDDTALDHRVIEVIYGLNEIALEKQPIDRTNCVVAKAFTPQGERAENVRYGFEWTRNGSDPSSEGVSTFRDVDGVDLVDLKNFYSFDIEDWPSGTEMFMTARTSAYGKARVPFTQGQREASFRFEVPCELEVAITGSIQGGGYTVTVYDDSVETDSPRQLRSARQGTRGGDTKINSSGIVRFHGLSPGPVTVKLERTMRWWGSGIVIEEQDIALSGREHRVDFQAASMNDVALVITPTKKPRSIQLMVRDEKATDGERFVMWGTSNAEGLVTLRSLPAGEYVAVDQKTGARLEVTAPCSLLRWDLSEYATKISVSISRQDGRLTEWGFLGGDVVSALNGERIEESGDILEHLHGSKATLTVERGESTVDIEVPRYPRETRKASPLGGRFFIRN